MAIELAGPGCRPGYIRSPSARRAKGSKLLLPGGPLQAASWSRALFAAGGWVTDSGQW